MHPATNHPPQSASLATALRRIPLLLQRPCEATLILLLTVWVLAVPATGIGLALRGPGFAIEDSHQGAVVTAALRILDGLPLYPDFLLHEAYYSYGPLGPLALAATMAAFGRSLAVAEAFGLFRAIAALAVVGAVAWRAGRSPLAALLAMGLFASLMRLLYFWHFNIHPESLATMLLLGGLLAADSCVRTERRTLTGIVAGVLLALAVLSKQNYAIPAAVVLIWTGARCGVPLALRMSLPFLAVLVFAVLLFETGNEHFCATSLLFRAHPMLASDEKNTRLLGMLRETAPLLLLAGAPLLIPKRLANAVAAPPTRGWTAPALAALAMGVLGYCKAGGGANSLFCLGALLSVFAGAHVAMFRRAAGTGVVARLRYVCVLLLCIGFLHVQFVRLVETPIQDVFGLSRMVDYEHLRRFLQRHRDASIYFPERVYVVYLETGRCESCDWMTEVLYYAGLDAPRGVSRKIREGRYDFILGHFTTPELIELSARHYRSLQPSPLGRIEVRVPRPRHETAPSPKAP